MKQELKKRLKAVVAGDVHFDVPLAPLTSFKIGGPADCFIKISRRPRT
jgi:hypothetical protein